MSMKNPVIYLISKTVNGAKQHYLYVSALFTQSGYEAVSYDVPTDDGTNPVNVTLNVQQSGVPLRQASVINQQIPVTSINLTTQREFVVTIKKGTETLATSSYTVIVVSQDDEEEVRPLFLQTL